MRCPRYVTYASLVALMLLLGARLQADPRLPPVGQRTYILNDAASPVVIRPDHGQSRGVYLRDPGRSAKVSKPELPPPRATAKRPIPTQRRASQLRFETLTVGGQLLRPRVEFARELLPVGRADEPVAGEFFDRVFAPARDDAF